MVQKQQVSEEIRDEEFTKAIEGVLRHDKTVLRHDKTLLERLAKI